MKAYVYEKYGPPEILREREVPLPVLGAGEVLIEVRAVALNAADWRILRADPFLARLNSGVLRPRHRILGCDISGIVVAAGPSSSQFSAGDEVLGTLFDSGRGGLAQYARAKEVNLVRKPASLSFAEAASLVMAGTTALQAVRSFGKVRPLQKVAVQGAGGGVGNFTVQLAKLWGAEVTAICGPDNIALVKALGADHVINYREQDFTRQGVSYDLILAVNGFRDLADYRRALTPQGRYLMVGGNNKQIFQALLRGPWLSMGSKQSFSALTITSTQADLQLLADLANEGKICSVIDTVYDWERTREAFHHLESGHARGKIVVTPPPISA